MRFYNVPHYERKPGIFRSWSSAIGFLAVIAFAYAVVGGIGYGLWWLIF